MAYDLNPMEELHVRIAAEITPYLYFNYSEWEDANEADREQALEIASKIIEELDLAEELPEGDNPRLSRYATPWSQR